MKGFQEDIASKSVSNFQTISAGAVDLELGLNSPQHVLLDPLQLHRIVTYERRGNPIDPLLLLTTGLGAQLVKDRGFIPARDPLHL